MAMIGTHKWSCKGGGGGDRLGYELVRKQQQYQKKQGSKRRDCKNQNHKKKSKGREARDGRD